MPTARGWSVAVTGLVIWALGRVLGAGPMEQLGFAVMALVVIAAGVVRFGSHDVSARRDLSPTRARAHQPVTVRVVVRNRGKGRAPQLLLEDRLAAGVAGDPRMGVDGIEPGGDREAAFRVRPQRRGRYDVGPLVVSFLDPFGLARVAREAVPAQPLVVYPAIHELGMPRDTGERETAAVSSLRQFTVSRGEDFYTLRDYAEGDDLRKVHWPSTAKRGRLMIKQEEAPWHARATIVLDDCDGHHDGFGESHSFERAVETAASLVDLYHRSGHAYRLMGAVDDGVEPARGPEHYRRCLETLATATTRRGLDEDALALRLAEIRAGSAAEAALAVVAGSVSIDAAVALAGCRRRFRQVVLVTFPAHRFGSGSTRSRWEGEKSLVETTALLDRAGIRSLVLGPDESLPSAWSSLSQPRAGERKRSWGQKPELV